MIHSQYKSQKWQAEDYSPGFFSRILGRKEFNRHPNRHQNLQDREDKIKEPGAWDYYNRRRSENKKKQPSCCLMPGLTDAAQWRLSSRAAGVHQKREKKKQERQRTRNSSHFKDHPGIGKADHGDRNSGLHRPDQPIFREFYRCRVSVDAPALIRAFSASPAYHRCIIAHPMD